MHAKLLVFIVKYANVWQSRLSRRHGYFSSLHSLLGFTDQGKYTDNVRNYGLIPPKVNYSTDNPSSKLISSGEQSHTTMQGQSLLHYSVTYIYVQANKFVCLLGKKTSFGAVGLLAFLFCFVCLFVFSLKVTKF